MKQRNEGYPSLRKLRKIRKYSQSEVADLLGVSLTTYSFKENGSFGRDFTVTEAKQIMDLLDAGFEEIFF